MSYESKGNLVKLDVELENNLNFDQNYVEKKF